MEVCHQEESCRKNEGRKEGERRQEEGHRQEVKRRQKDLEEHLGSTEEQHHAKGSEIVQRLKISIPPLTTRLAASQKRVPFIFIFFFFITDLRILDAAGPRL